MRGWLGSNDCFTPSSEPQTKTRKRRRKFTSNLVVVTAPKNRKIVAAKIWVQGNADIRGGIKIIFVRRLALRSFKDASSHWRVAFSPRLMTSMSIVQYSADRERYERDV